MSLIQAHVVHPFYSDTCHVCGKPLRACDSSVEHDGWVRTHHHERSSSGSIGLHVECATILAMRLIADVMDHKGSAHEPRVVISLRNACDAKLKEF
jgi:hypothetical protein